MLKDENQSGSVAMITLMLIVGVSLFYFGQLASKSQNVLNQGFHDSLIAEKNQIKARIKYAASCEVAIPLTCTGDQKLSLKSKTGNTLVSADGLQKIGHWNVKVQCKSPSSEGFWIFAARLDAKLQATKDPLTGKLLDWTPVAKLARDCDGASVPERKLVHNTCYGTITGTHSLPPEIAKLCANVPGTDLGCTFSGKYCGDQQIDYPPCEPGYHSLYRYMDRFGWGGIDISKFTMCEKDPT